MSFPERWKQYDENYWVSDQGRVKRVHKNGKEIILKPVPRDKTLRVKIYRNYVNLNKLVWKTFKGEIPEGYYVLNKNRCYTMNDVYSLKLFKVSEIKGRHHGRSVIDLKTGLVYPSTRFAGRKLNISHNWVGVICRGEKQSEKYKLEYYNEEKEYPYARRVK